MPSEYAYWNIRGYGQAIRDLLVFVGEDFKERRYVWTKDNNRDDWLNEKFKQGLQFPNLPYYKDDKVKITQSYTILRYLGRKYNLTAKNDEDLIQLDQVADESFDLRTLWSILCYDPNFEKLKKQTLDERVRPKIKALSDYLDNKDWFIGNYLTWVDFTLYEILDQYRILENCILDPTPNLKAFLDRFEGLPAIKAYQASDNHIKRPINAPIAFYNN